MQDWFSHPGVQAGLVPFVVALAIGFALARTRGLAIAALAGIVAVLALTIGFSIEPFTSVKKALVAVLALSAVALALDLARVAPGGAVRAALSLLAGVAAVWSIGRVLAQQEGSAPWLAGFAAFAFAAVLVAGALAAATSSSLGTAALGAVLGWGAGLMALLGASALLAQIGLAVGSAAAGVALAQLLLRRESPLGWSLVVPPAATAALVGVLASATGELKAWTLVPLVLVPVAAALAAPATLAALERRPAEARSAGRLWWLALRVGFAALVPAAVALVLAWKFTASAAA